MEEDVIEPITEWPVSVADSAATSSNVSQSESQLAVSTALTDIDDCKSNLEVLADVSLARWWRREGRNLVDRSSIPEGCSPNTLLSFISRTDEAMKYMRGEVKRLRLRIEKGDSSASVQAALGALFEKMGNLKVAEMHLEEAVRQAPSEARYHWLLAKVHRQIQVRQQKETFLSSSSLKDLKEMSAIQQVKRVSAAHLTFSEFFHNYAVRGIPVIITDCVNGMSVVPWTVMHINNIAGHCMATLKKAIPESVEWARLEDSKTMTVSNFIDSIQNPGLRPDTSQLCLFDWSIPLHCPELAKQLTIPKYFAGDFLQRTSAGSLYQDSWPSLFLAPAGITTELHIDAFSSNFWMALFEGKKRWTFFKKENMPLLYPQYEHSLDPVFEVDLSSPDLEQFPLLKVAQPIQCVLEAGELLFVPAGCPHRVENLETSLAISSNFVDLSNFEAVRKELAINALVDPRSEDLLSQMNSDKFMGSMNSKIEDMKWSAYKSWPPDDYSNYDITSCTELDKTTK